MSFKKKNIIAPSVFVVFTLWLAKLSFFSRLCPNIFKCIYNKNANINLQRRRLLFLPMVENYLQRRIGFVQTLERARNGRRVGTG